MNKQELERAKKREIKIEKKKKLELDIVRLSEEGLTVREIIKTLGCGSSYASRILVENRGRLNKPSQPELVIELLKEGKTQKQICQISGCQPEMVSAMSIEFRGGLCLTGSAKDRLEAKLKLNLETGCKEWQGAVTNDGYGEIKLNNVNYRTHRLAYSLYVGEIPNNLHVLHKCDVPQCCEPSHLFLGTNSDNVADKVAKGRQPTKMSVESIKVCLELKKQGKSNRSIARELGVCHTVVNKWLKRNKV